MKKLILAFGILFASSHAFADETCGCKTHIVDLHLHQGIECEADEVMVGHDMVNGIVKCGTVQCSCACKPEAKAEKKASN